MHEGLCICSLLPKIETRTHLMLFIHRDEERKPTNTGSLAARCLPNSSVHVRGNGSDSSFEPSAESQAVLLFPSDEAVPLATFAQSLRPVTLIVPDGTWRQAAKMRQRVPGLAQLPMVSIPHDAPTTYRLRNETRDRGLATMEAIARAMGILEGPQVRQALEAIFHIMVERTLWSRGQGVRG